MCRNNQHTLIRVQSDPIVPFQKKADCLKSAAGSVRLFCPASACPYDSAAQGFLLSEIRIHAAPADLMDSTSKIIQKGEKNMNGWTMKSCTSISIRKRSWRHSPPFSKIAFPPNRKREVRQRVKRNWNLVSCPVCPLYLWATVVSSGGRTSVQNQISAASKQTTPTVALPKSNR